MSSTFEAIVSEPTAHANIPSQQQSKQQEPKPRRPRGRGAKARASEKFLHQANAKCALERRIAAQKRLGVFNQDAAALEESLRSMMVTVQPRAIPLPVATRGAGFTTVAEFSRLVSSWNQDVVMTICTIYQYYRVTLFLISFKVYHSRYVQHKEESFPCSSRFIMDEEYRQVLQTVSQVPISTYNILCSIGLIEGEASFNCFFPDQGLDYGQDVALYLTPFNIREALTVISDPESNVEHRRRFYELNPLPGARFVEDPVNGPVLQNANDIWPDGYGVENLIADVHAYSNLLTRAGNRLPKSFLVNFEWNARGSKPSTVCMYTVPSRLSAQFRRRCLTPTRKKTRAADGRERELNLPQDEYTYVGDTQLGIAPVVECWSVDGTVTAMEMTTGCATYVGEVERIQSRLQIQGRLFAHISPGNVLYKMVDAPRA